jgi:hypothetical protein
MVAASASFCPSSSHDNPYSEAAFKTLKYCPAFDPRRSSILRTVFRVLQRTALPLRHRFTHPSHRSFRTSRPDHQCTYQNPCSCFCGEPAPLLPPTNPTTTTRQSMDQRPEPRSPHQNQLINTTGLKPLDKFRTCETRVLISCHLDSVVRHDLVMRKPASSLTVSSARDRAQIQEPLHQHRAWVERLKTTRVEPF